MLRSHGSRLRDIVDNRSNQAFPESETSAMSIFTLPVVAIKSGKQER